MDIESLERAVHKVRTAEADAIDAECNAEDYALIANSCDGRGDREGGELFRGVANKLKIIARGSRGKSRNVREFYSSEFREALWGGLVDWES